MYIICILWFQVGWYSDSSGLHIDLEEDGTFQDYDGENEVGVTPPAFPLTEKPRSAPFVTTDQRPASRPKVALGGDRDRNNKQDFSAIETTTTSKVVGLMLSPPRDNDPWTETLILE